MPKKVFRLTGTFQTGHHTQDFSKEFVADSEARARELLLAILGSKHAVPRRLVKVANVVQVAPDQIEDPVVRHTAGA